MDKPPAAVLYLAIVFVLLVIPRALQRFRLPAPLTCFAFGIVVAIFLKDLVHDGVVEAMATLGIASLFLFAGLEVDLSDIRKNALRLSGHLAVRSLVLGGFAWLAMRYFHLAWQSAALVSLALFTPSAGFILDSLPHSGLSESEQSEVTLNAIAGEILALVLLFFVSQAGSTQALLVSGGALILLIALTPFVFLLLGRFVVPYAPGSEFSLLLMVGLICAVITKALGVYYLVGAFVAGLVAGSLRERMASLASKGNLHAIRLFASFFIPFYFFHGGLGVPAGALVLESLLYGFAMAVIALPLRMLSVWLQARFLVGREFKGSFRVAVALTPTLIFTLVIAGILREKFALSDSLYGGLLVYAAISTILPSLVLPGFVESSAFKPGKTAEPLLTPAGPDSGVAA
jgi:Kef-type K+ transport system membrane component KefB